MYGWVLTAHGAWRWVVVIAGIVAVTDALRGIVLAKPWEPGGTWPGRLFGIAVDIQVAMGAVLYLALSPLTTLTPGLSGAANTGGETMFFAVTHAAVMGAAFVCVHIAAVMVRRGRGDVARRRRAALLYGLTLGLILVGIPWWRPWIRL
jgi:hypothetical protein